MEESILNAVSGVLILVLCCGCLLILGLCGGVIINYVDRAMDYIDKAVKDRSSRNKEG